uniref:Uncharacterized protein n=1 Tax=Strongyloides venezuelensis TaxID=75913 RepID=A0A0K0G5T6_STRVS
MEFEISFVTIISFLELHSEPKISLIPTLSKVKNFKNCLTYSTIDGERQYFFYFANDILKQGKNLVDVLSSFLLLNTLCDVYIIQKESKCIYQLVLTLAYQKPAIFRKDRSFNAKNIEKIVKYFKDKLYNMPWLRKIFRLVRLFVSL